MTLRFIIPSLLIATTCAFLVSLGFWQLDRADEKRSIEAAIKKANSGAVELIVSEDNLQDKEYYQVRLQGEYITISSLFMITKLLIRFQATMFSLLLH